MPNLNKVKLLTKLKRFERDTTLMKEIFSYEFHRKSYSRWKKWTYDLGLRKFSNMFDFPNFHLKLHHDPSFKWKSVQYESCSSWSHLSKKSYIISFGQRMKDLRMGAMWETIWMIFTSTFQTRLHGHMTWFQHDSHSLLELNTSLDGPITRPCKHAKRITKIGHVWKCVEMNIFGFKYNHHCSKLRTSSPSFEPAIQTLTIKG